MLDGNMDYKGANYKNFKQRIDKAFQKYLTLADNFVSPVKDLVRKYKMNESNFRRIGVYAILQQKDGVEKLEANGIDENEYKSLILTDEEMKVYQSMRESLDLMRPLVETVMREVYNAPLGEVENYFPFITDFENMSEFEIRDRFGDKAEYKPLKKNVEKGFTKERKGGKVAIKLDAFDIFVNHVDNVAYLLEVGREAKMMGEIANSKEYREAVGEYGQEIVREWVDLIARKGGHQEGNIHILNVIRNSTAIAQLGFRLSTILVQGTALFDGAALIGSWAFEGARRFAVSPEIRKFLVDNFAEYKHRVGDDIAYLGFGKQGYTKKAADIGLYAIKKFDKLTAGSVLFGAYLKSLKDNGKKFDINNVDEQARIEALKVYRRTQASSTFKDIPSALSSGTLTGSKSVDRLLLQFQTFMLNRWSLIEHDFYRLGIKEKNFGKATNIAMFLLMANIAEMGMRYATNSFIDMISGREPDDEEEDLMNKFTMNLLQTVPFVSSIVASFSYGSNPVPSISFIEKAIKRGYYAIKTEDDETRARNAAKFFILIGGLLTGMPGAGQAEQMIQ
jgi:hypothetical protein